MWRLAREDGVAMRVVPEGRVVGTPAALDRIEAMAIDEFKRVLKTRSRRLPDTELRALIERLTADVEELPDAE